MTIRDFTKVIAPMWAMAFVANIALAQQSAVQLAQGQSAEQQQKDMADCQAIAKQSTGYDPAAPPQAAAPTEPERGGRVRGAAKAATASAVRSEVKGQQYDAYDKLSDDVKQEYRQNEAKSAAAAGAVVGGSRQRQERREQDKAQEQQAAQANAATSAYDQAYKSCMMGRGYSAP
jgi:hypothetical protein